MLVWSFTPAISNWTAHVPCRVRRPREGQAIFCLKQPPQTAGAGKHANTSRYQHIRWGNGSLRVHGKNSQILRNDVLKTKLLPWRGSGPLQLVFPGSAASSSSSRTSKSPILYPSDSFKDTNYFIFDRALLCYIWLELSSWIKNLLGKMVRDTDTWLHQPLPSTADAHLRLPGPVTIRIFGFCLAGLRADFGLSPAGETDLVWSVFSCFLSLNSYQLK